MQVMIVFFRVFLPGFWMKSQMILKEVVERDKEFTQKRCILERLPRNYLTRLPRKESLGLLPFLLFEASQPWSTRVLLLSSLYHDSEAKVINEGHEGTASSFSLVPSIEWFFPSAEQLP